MRFQPPPLGGDEHFLLSLAHGGAPAISKKIFSARPNPRPSQHVLATQRLDLLIGLDRALISGPHAEASWRSYPEQNQARSPSLLPNALPTLAE